MNYRTLGPGVRRVSEVSLGTWLTAGGRVDVDRTRACVRAALQIGILGARAPDVRAHREQM